MLTQDVDERARKCKEAQAAFKAHEASPGIDEDWSTWEAVLRGLARERDRLCADMDQATTMAPATSG
jgi:hypothetical protein